MHREELRNYLDGLLETACFRDYCPNGLQVEGRAEVRRVVCGVTASQALLDEAIRRKADAVLVHHGWFWKSDDLRVTGIRRRRMATLIGGDLNLFAYHLPLDAHPDLGNNAELARRAGWRIEGRFGEQDIGFVGTPPAVAPAAAIAAALEKLLGRAPMVVGDANRQVTRLAWCSGGAQGIFEEAISAGADCFISGEISEQTFHLARETGVPYIAAGHHATERFGVMALGAHLAEKFGLDCQFVDIDNPV
ncbi:MAG: Nif3-like dinuclear metal center hexameric protein [Gammaproteobacteria bacterium]|nr:Nif3-like dinuclear metal center hexameric protein [Gammaproteobacteria bacterium]MBU1415814.1 Nif3-like dinuclear metal center hexameric protein [Gammaproteobacteria bacterium]